MLRVFWQELEAFDADVVVLQEVAAELLEQRLRPWAQRHAYEVSLYMKGKKLLWRTSRSPDDAFEAQMFEAQHQTSFCFSDIDISDTEHDPNHWVWAEVRKRSKGAVLALLRHRPSGRTVAVVGMHLFFDKKFPDVKLAQAHLLCKQVAAVLEERCAAASTIPLVLAGDFNSTWRRRHKNKHRSSSQQMRFSGVYCLLARGRLDDSAHPHHPARVRAFHNFQQAVQAPHGVGSAGQELLVFTTHGLGRLQSAYMQALGREPPLTIKTANWGGCLDYILLSGGSGHWAVTEVLDMPGLSYSAAVHSRRSKLDLVAPANSVLRFDNRDFHLGTQTTRATTAALKQGQRGHLTQQSSLMMSTQSAAGQCSPTATTQVTTCP